MDKVKSLAIKLDLVETYKVGSKSNSRHGIKKDQSQTLDYVIVIDFESTCWESKDQSPRWQKLPEIIEFPAVLLNVSSGLIEDQFHHYVMPIENPALSEFCVKLTGISQELVNGGIPLGTCVMLFNQWIQKISNEKKLSFHKSSPDHKTCTFVTWSDWDLAVCLQNETRRKQIRKPDILSQWIDLRLCYRKFYQRRPQGLKGALADLGLPFEGREHSGIIDAKNTANLVNRMVKDGFHLNITSSSDLSSPQINSKRHPLQTLKGISTPVTRKTCNSFNDHSSNVVCSYSSPLKGQVKKSFKRGNAIYNDDDERTGIMQHQNKSHHNSIIKNTDLNRLGRTSTPKMRNITMSNCKRTPPLCRCGRRAISKVANSPGPNLGRTFFTCPNQRRSLGMVSKGCSFFMWC